MESDEPRWLSPDEQRAWRIYLRVTARVEEALNRDLVDHYGHSLPEYEILSRLSEAEGGSLRMSDLADLLVFSRSRLTHTVRRLEERGLVERSTNARDGRGVDCRLTAEGERLVKQMSVGHVKSVRAHLVDRLGHDRMVELGRILEVLLDDPAGSGAAAAPRARRVDGGEEIRTGEGGAASAADRQADDVDGGQTNDTEEPRA